MKSEISVYIHIPFCRSKCSYCDFFSKPGIENLIDAYVDSLCREIEFYSTGSQKFLLKTLYIGGGTPSLLSINQLSRIFSVLQNCFKICGEGFEATIELNPDDVSKELIEFLNQSFITRISLGIQSLKQKTLSSMCRRASRETSLKALSIISENFTKRFSADLIAGFPGESEKDVKENIDELLEYSPEHISLYSLCVEEGTLLYRQIESEKIPFDQSESDSVWLSAKTYLEKKNFFQYEISNFSKSEKTQSRHNLTYWHLENYLGFGSGATGSLFFEEHKGIRYTNTDDIEKYISFWKREGYTNPDFSDYDKMIFHFENIPCCLEKINYETEEFEFLMMNFRLREGVSSVNYKKRFDRNLETRLGLNDGLFKEWKDKGLAECKGDFFRLNEKGILFLNSFLESL